MDDHARELLRRTFTEDAELYARARPAYTPELFADLQQLAGTGPGCRVLEIGCGTGQATLPLAKQGCDIVAVELGAEMATVARRTLADFPSVRVENATFEEWSLPAESFDVVFAATSFRWVDPAIRVSKAADALRPGGMLALVATHHVAGGTAAFFDEVQDCYERFDPATPPGLRLSPADAIPHDDELKGTDRFGPPAFHRYKWECTYSTEQYLQVLCTYSNHRLLPTPARSGLLNCIARLIDDKHGGQITKRYLFELQLAARTT